MKIEEAFMRFVGKDCLVYTVSTGSLQYSMIDCIVEEVGDGWVRISENIDDNKNESIINTDNIIRIRDYPLNKKGKKKIII